MGLSAIRAAAAPVGGFPLFALLVYVANEYPTIYARVGAPALEMNGGKGIYVGGTLVSILISLALYYTGKRESAIFVGLWAPTILNLGQTLLEED